MLNKDQEITPKTVQVPQYEEFRTGNWLGTIMQWLGGIGLVIMGVSYLRFPELFSEGAWVLWIVGLFLAMFLIPAIRGGIRHRENQRISSQNRKKYDQYRSALESDNQKTK